MKRRNLEQIDVNVELPFADRRQHDHLHIKSERRKVRKVIVERKRRERIDRCLDQLRQFLIDNSSSISSNRQLQGGGDLCGSGPSSNLEKADILELTVDHLRLLRTRTDQQRAHGYNRCATEVDQFLRASCPEGEMRRRLMAFLARRQPPQQPTQSPSLFGRQTGPCWSADGVSTAGFDEHRRLGTSLGFETMATTDSRTAFSSVIPCLVNHAARQPSSASNRVEQPSPINNVQSAVVDTTINEELQRRIVESEDDDENFEEGHVDEKHNQSSVTKSQRCKTKSQKSSSRSAVHDLIDLTNDSVRLAQGLGLAGKHSTDDSVKDTLCANDGKESVWRPW